MLMLHLHLGIKKYENVRQCGIYQLECMLSIRAKISSLLPPKNSIGFTLAGNYSDIGLQCDECLPDCHHIVSL